MTHTKIMQLWNTSLELYDGRTPISELEKALTVLPNSFLLFKDSKDVDLLVRGDPAYGIYMIPKNPERLKQISFPNEVKDRKPRKNNEGTFVSFIYKDRAYTLRITNANIEL